MCEGNLTGKLVRADFWPTCANCEHMAECQQHARHPAYPHTWHWGYECGRFGETMLVLKSWVGTIAIGESHTGCYSYCVAPHCLLPLTPALQHYITLQHEIDKLNADLEVAEGQGAYNKRIEAQYDQLEKLIDEQKRLVMEVEPRA